MQNITQRFKYLRDRQEIMGKTIEKIVPHGYSLFVKFTDDTWTEISSVTDGEDPTTPEIGWDLQNDETGQSLALYNLDLISKEEMEEILADSRIESDKRSREFRRKQYEHLKKEFENEGN